MVAQIPRPEHVTGFLNAPFFVLYWPLILGVVMAMVFAVAGRGRMTILVMVLAVLAQLWRSGIFG